LSNPFEGQRIRYFIVNQEDSRIITYLYKKVVMNDKKDNKEKDLNNKLGAFLKTNNKECESDECQINEPDELVQREHKKIITNDGRQLLSEYTKR
jgi:hypothetical protein